MKYATMNKFLRSVLTTIFCSLFFIASAQPPPDGSATVECIVDAFQVPPPVFLDGCGNTTTPVITENPDPFCEGNKVYTYTYTDCIGGVDIWVFTYTIDLTSAPVAPANSGSTVECIIDCVQPAAPTVVDNCGNNIVPVITENADPMCEGDKIYTFTYTDCANNTTVWTYTYTIDRTTLPLVPIDDGSTVDDIAAAVPPLGPIVTDVCGGLIQAVVTSNPDPECEGQKIYTYVYYDCNGMSSTWTYTYTISYITTLVTSPVNNGITENNGTLTATSFGVGVTYQWIDCVDSLTIVPGENGQSYTPPAVGAFAVQVTDGSCTVTSPCMIGGVVGLSESKPVKTINISPNPATNYFKIDLNDNQAGTFEVSDNFGKIILSESSIKQDASIDISHLAKGVYFVSLKSTDRTSVVKLIKR
jgi:Secretion system C-terminal sorting domain